MPRAVRTCMTPLVLCSLQEHEEVMEMTSKAVTGKQAASAAATTLNSKSASKAAKTAAASALAQTPSRRRK